MSEPLRTYDSLAGAAAGLGLSIDVLRAAKRAGCPAFRSNRVYSSELLAWLKAHPQTVTPGMKEQKLAEEVRKLKLVNDQREGRLVDRAWVSEQIMRMAAKLNDARLRSEEEDPVRFSEFCPGANVVACRTILRGIWTQIMKDIAALGSYLAESQPRMSAGHRKVRTKASSRRAKA